MKAPWAPEGLWGGGRNWRGGSRGDSAQVIKARAAARNLMRGKQIRDLGDHHAGMAKLKEWMGDPRPEGMTLSLVGDGPACYDGTSKGRAYRLSADPRDYVWESFRENVARRRGVRKAGDSIG